MIKSVKMPDNCTKYNQNVPAWINESYFEKMLNKRMPHFVKILKFVIIPATPSAEKSSSIMLRIKMEIELEGKTRVQLLLFHIYS